MGEVLLPAVLTTAVANDHGHLLVVSPHNSVRGQLRRVPGGRPVGTSLAEKAFSCCRRNISGLTCASMETNPASPRTRWFTAKEAAEYIGVHIDTLYGYTKLRKNKPPCLKLGNDRRYRFPKDQFIKWANGQ